MSSHAISLKPISFRSRSSGAIRKLMDPSSAQGTGIEGLAAVSHEDVVEYQSAAWFEDANDLCIKCRLVIDVHLGMLGPRSVEHAISEGHIQSAPVVEVDYVAESHPFRQSLRDFAVFPCQVDACHVTAVLGGKVPSRASKTTAHVDHSQARRQPSELREFDGRLSTADVEFIHRSQIGWVKPFEVLARGSKRLENRFEQPAGFVMFFDRLYRPVQ